MATYYVDGAVGDDANAGTSEGSGNAWATIDHAMNQVVAGDKVFVKSSATYTETATIDTAGNNTTGPIVFEGYDTTTGDGGKVTIDAESTRSSCINDTISGTAYYVFRNFILVNSTGNGASLANVHQIMWHNCEFNNNSSTGCFAGNGQVWSKCTATGNGNDGLDGGTTCTALFCVVSANVLDGVELGYGTVAFCTFSSNAGVAINFLGSNGFACVSLNNTFDGDADDTKSGIQFPSSFWGPFAAVNNIIYDCLTGMTGLDQGERLLSYNNLVNDNGTDYDTGYQTFDGEVTSAPQFTDEAAGDYTLAAASPARNAGLNEADTGMDIGSNQSQDSGGGGGGSSGATFMRTGGQL